MANYHLSAKTISRSGGRSAVAAIAYRAAERLVDERTGIVHDYTTKGDVIEKEILLPDGAPAWMGERDKLWNAVELGERRKDAQLARELTISLPRELSAQDNWALAKTFVRDTFVSKGMVADVCFHLGDKSDDMQPHVHVMLTMRDIVGDGFGAKNRSWNQKALLCEWRESWAQYCNQKLMMLGIDARIDHRTLEAQGIKLEPQSKIGPVAASARMARFEAHQEIARQNGQRILSDPMIAFHALTCQQSTFTDNDIARFINRHTVDSEQFQHVHAVLKGHSELVELGTDDRGSVRFSTRTRVRDEHTLLKNAYDLSHRGDHVVSCPPDILVQESRAPLSKPQIDAVTHLIESDDMVCLVGIAGSGKSTLLDSARHQWEVADFKVKGATLAGIAAQNLTESSGIPSRTIASWCHRWSKGEDRLTSDDILVIDEAGMVDVHQALTLVNEVKQSGAKLVLIGDAEQLQAIGPGSAFRAIVDEIGAYNLDTVYRQKDAWQQMATKDFAKRNTEKGLSAYMQHERVHAFETKAVAITQLMDDWHTERLEKPDDSQLMLAYHRSSVRTLNEMARERLKNDGRLDKEVEIETHQGIRQFATGDRVYFLKNEYHDLDIKNGTLGTVTALDEKTVNVKLDPIQGKTRDVKVDLSKYNHLEHGYAATIHKAQGTTVDRSFVLASKRFDSHVTYVSMSRHREAADLYYSKEDFPSFNALGRHVAQGHHKDMTTDYAYRHGLDKSVLGIERATTHERLRDTITDDAKQRAASRLLARAKDAGDAIASYFDDDKRQTRDMRKSVKSLSQERQGNAMKRLEARQFEKALNAFKREHGLDSLSMNPEQGDTGKCLGKYQIDKKSCYIIHNAHTNKTFAITENQQGHLYKNDRVIFEQERDNHSHQNSKSWSVDHSDKNIEKQQVAEKSLKQQQKVHPPKSEIARQITKSIDRGFGIEM